MTDDALKIGLGALQGLASTTVFVLVLFIDYLSSEVGILLVVFIL